MPRPKRAEKPRIWRPGVPVGRGGAQLAVREIPGAGGAGWQNFRFPVFQEADIRANGLERLESAHFGHSVNRFFEFSLPIDVIPERA
jgi:hypothetical protein